MTLLVLKAQSSYAAAPRVKSCVYNQSINQSKRIYIAPYVAGESEARNCLV